MSDIKVAVLGGGAWGTALAANSVRAGHQVYQWVRDEDLATSIHENRTNPKYLPDIELPKGINAQSDITVCLSGADIILLATPAQTIGDLADAISPLVRVGTVCVSCAKGIDRATGLLPSELAGNALPGIEVAVLSGPSFATDLVKGLPTAVSIGAHDIALADDLSEALTSPNFRCYANDDIKGVELGGALKNVLALGVGIARGLELGASAEAALIARGFAELQRLAISAGAKPQTLSGLSGLGDLVLTCSSPKSRNFAYGMALGRSDNLDGLPLAEGVFTANAALELADLNTIDTPIIEAVSMVIDGDISAAEAVKNLLSRPLKRE